MDPIRGHALPLTFAGRKQDLAAAIDAQPSRAGPANNPFASRPPSGFIPPMPRKVSEIVEEARQLPYGERTELIEQLIADSAQSLDPEIEKAWTDEARRRIKEIEEGKVKGIPIEEALARVRKTVGL
jgi:putative addiction module component (TIGR02574 family)